VQTGKNIVVCDSIETFEDSDMLCSIPWWVVVAVYVKRVLLYSLSSSLRGRR